MSEQPLRVGDVVRDHRPKALPVPYGRIVLVSPVDDLAMIAPFPKKDKHGNVRNYFRKAVPHSIHKLRGELDGVNATRSIVEFETPSHWLIASEQMTKTNVEGATGQTRRNLERWEPKAQTAYERIRPFVQGRTIEEVLMDPDLASWPAKRSKELGLIGVSQVQRDLNAYIFGLGLPAALRPFYSRCGAPGKAKFSKRKTGCRNIGVRKIGPEHEGLNTDPYAREAFIRGWKKYKTRGTSIQQAFAMTLKEWFAKSGRWVSGGKFECDIKPEALRYTVHQFEYWGRKGPGALSALQIERGETAAKREYLRRLNSIGENFATVNGNAFIDSTSTDVTLVSVASRQTVLMAPWRTEVLGAGLNYIFGTHVTFDSPSNMTALLAILHAAEDKVAFCARFGITIAPRDWYSMTFHRIHVDNGDAKGKLAEQQVSDMETGSHYGMTNDASNKFPSESNHQADHRHVDHKIPGTTHGRRPVRGEPSASETARWHYFEYMPKLIKHVLHHNNVEQVPQLLTLAMRRDGVEPTRRGILEWMMAKGYVSSAATDLNSLRVRCLPRLKGVIHADGIHIFHPWSESPRLIPKILYRSAWLMNSGLLEAASTRAKRVDVHLDPMNLQQAWVNLDGLRPLQLKTNDPDMLEVTLLDWCRISDDDKLIAFLDKAQATRRSIQDVAENNAITANAQRELNAEIQRDGKKTKTERNSDRRHTTAVENAAMTGRIPPERRGASKAPEAPKPPTMVTASIQGDRAPRTSAPLASSPLASLIDEIRSTPPDTLTTPHHD